MNKLAVLSRRTSILIALLSVLGGCEHAGDTAKYALIGGAVGAGAGVIGMAATSGCVPCGAAIGAAVGAGIGVAFDILEHKR